MLEGADVLLVIVGGLSIIAGFALVADAKLSRETPEEFSQAVKFSGMSETEFLKLRAKRVPMGVGWMAFGCFALYVALR